MKRWITLGILLGLAGPARAHALDEYLQATTLSLSPHQVFVQLRLTPGVKVSEAVLADIDSNGDGVVSPAEQEAYTDRVRRELSLSLDGNPLTLKPISVSYPEITRMREGVGEIVLGFEADLDEYGDGRGIRKLTFENHNDSKIAAYAVNCVQPKDPGTRILATDRFQDQSVFRMDYIEAKSGPSSLIAEGLAFLAALIIFGLRQAAGRKK